MDTEQQSSLALLRLPIKQSLPIHLAVIIIYILSILIPWMTGLSLAQKISVSLIVILSWVIGYRRKLNDAFKQQSQELIANASDEWQLRMTDGQVVAVELANVQFVHPWLVIVRVVHAGKKQSFIFTPDMLEEHLFRCLRIRLLHRMGND